jgi:hypothetical protein
MLRISHLDDLDDRLTDGSKVVSPTHQPLYTRYASETHVCYTLSTPQGLVRNEGLCKLNINSLQRALNLRPSG